MVSIMRYVQGGESAVDRKMRKLKVEYELKNILK